MNSQNIKLQRKTSMTYFDLIAWVTENKKIIEGCIIDNVFLVQNSENTYIFKLHCSGRDQDLIIEPGKRINLTKYNYPKISSPKITILRELVREDIITDIHIIDKERIVVLELRRDGKKIIAELLPRGVLVITDKNNKILFTSENKEFKDRIIKSGETYKPPPTLQPRKEDIEKLIKNGNIAKALGIPQEVVSYLNLQDSLFDPEIAKSKVDNLEKSLLSGKIIPCMIKDVTVVPFKLNGCEEYQKFNDALDEYFYNIIQKELIERYSKKISEEKQKIMNTIKQLEESIKEYENKEKTYQEIANTVLLKAYEIDQLLSEQKQKNNKKIILNLNGVEVELDTSLTATKNAEKFFDKAKEYKRKIAKALESLSELKERLEKIEKQELEKQNEIKLILRKKEWYEKYRWSISRNGFLIIAGKDASQNESIVRKFLKDNDIFLHADIVGAPATVIFTQDKTINDEDIYDAAVMAACYSKAWKLDLAAVDVFWVFGNQVSKSPPSGEYLNKGSFMIYGKKNFVKNVKLELALGIVINGNTATIVVGSEEAVASKTKFYVIIAPGDDDKDKISQKILKVFARSLPEISGINALKVEIEDKIPGKSKIVKTSVTYNS
ncbi:ribosome rescue protein RqcH [Sulfolobus tengchongensis]|uniref:Ribosome rescue protein RqcH n=1 Tax=Sulfolobus tengchongensis TaxID=207809 RepID=A0AAX4KYJ2_9CREN